MTLFLSRRSSYFFVVCVWGRSYRKKEKRTSQKWRVSQRSRRPYDDDDDDVHSDKYINKTRENIPAGSLIFFWPSGRSSCMCLYSPPQKKLNIFLCCWRDEREETNKRQTTTGCPVYMCMGKKCLKLSWKCVPPDAWLLTAPGWPLMMKPVDPSIHPSIGEWKKKSQKK